jgi:hypothetical protein
LVEISVDQIYIYFINLFALFWKINFLIFKRRNRRGDLYLLRFYTLLFNFQSLFCIEYLLVLDGETLLITASLKIDTLEFWFFFIIFSSLWNWFSQRCSSCLFTLWLVNFFIIFGQRIIETLSIFLIIF